MLGGAVKVRGAFLYADLTDSTSLALKAKSLAAKVFQAFLSTMTRIIIAENGQIRSFDGDRVMGVFIGDRANDAAARCALKMQWAFVHWSSQSFWQPILRS
jgi:adenylate cyclase